MKYLLLLLICIVSIQQLTAQPHDTTLRNAYLIKSKSQKTTAWVLLGAGLAVTTTGVIIEASANNSEDIYSGLNDVATGALVAGIGVVACLTSIPFFIASGNNKKRAMSITSGVDEIMMPVKGGWAYNMQPAIKITIPLGH